MFLLFKLSGSCECSSCVKVFSHKTYSVKVSKACMNRFKLQRTDDLNYELNHSYLYRLKLSLEDLIKLANKIICNAIIFCSTFIHVILYIYHLIASQESSLSLQLPPKIISSSSVTVKIFRNNVKLCIL